MYFQLWGRTIQPARGLIQRDAPPLVTTCRTLFRISVTEVYFKRANNALVLRRFYDCAYVIKPLVILTSEAIAPSRGFPLSSEYVPKASFKNPSHILRKLMSMCSARGDSTFGLTSSHKGRFPRITTLPALQYNMIWLSGHAQS